MIPSASNKVEFSMEDGGTIIGPSQINAEAGIAAILVKADEKPGIIKITATSGGLIRGKLDFTVK